MGTAKNLPQHIAIIMDGNGRWAKKRLMPRLAGHRAGVESARKVIKACVKRGIEVLTLFAFSSENWRRPEKEVSHLMELLMTGLEKESPELAKNNIQLRFIGNRTRFSDKLQAKITEVENMTHGNTGMHLLIAADYGGQWDIAEAAKKIAAEVVAGSLDIDQINAECITQRLSFADLPDPDLFIRTSGEMRISNFLLWQLAYSELYFTNTLWPDFDEQELDRAIEHFAGRERRYGYSGEQLGTMTCSNSA